MDARLYTEGQHCSFPAMLDFIQMSQLSPFQTVFTVYLKVCALLSFLFQRWCYFVTHYMYILYIVYVISSLFIPYKKTSIKVMSCGCSGGICAQLFLGWEQSLPGVSAGCLVTSHCCLWCHICVDTVHTFINLS